MPIKHAFAGAFGDDPVPEPGSIELPEGICERPTKKVRDGYLHISWFVIRREQRGERIHVLMLVTAVIWRRCLPNLSRGRST
jgi:hypothetical protein